MDTIFAVFGDGWFIEVNDEWKANTIKQLLSGAGIEAHVREHLPVTYALVVEFYPKMAGQRNRAAKVRQHKWAYGEWKEGPPKGFNEITGDMPDLFAVERQYPATGAVVRYKSESQLTPDEQVKFLEAGVTPPARRMHVNAVTGRPTAFPDAAFWQG